MTGAESDPPRYDPREPGIYTSGNAPTGPSDDLALLVRILDTLPADLQERIPAADVVRIIHATLREVRR